MFSAVKWSLLVVVIVIGCLQTRLVISDAAVFPFSLRGYLKQPFKTIASLQMHWFATTTPFLYSFCFSISSGVPVENHDVHLDCWVLTESLSCRTANYVVKSLQQHFCFSAIFLTNHHLWSSSAPLHHHHHLISVPCQLSNNRLFLSLLLMRELRIPNKQFFF